MVFRLFIEKAFRLLLVIAGVWLSLPHLPIAAQVQAAVAERPDSKETAVAPNEQIPGQAANADRLLRLEDAVRSDKKRLLQLQRDLDKRIKLFDDLANRQRRIEKELVEKKNVVNRNTQAGETVDPVQAAEIGKLEQRHTMLKEQSEHTYQEARTLQIQIKALKQKIGKDQKAIEELTGIVSDEQAEESVADSAVEMIPEVTESTGGRSLPAIIPGVPMQPATPTEQTAAPLLETAEQIEARKDAEKRAVEARQAEQAVVDFLDRKAALEEQIALEKKMLGKARITRDKLNRRLLELSEKLQQEIASSASHAELQTTQQDIEQLQEHYYMIRQEIDDRRTHLDSLHVRLENLQKDQLRLNREAQEKRTEAEDARKRVIWLDSPLHPQNLWNWLATRGPRILLVLGVSMLLLLIIRLSIHTVARTVIRKARGERVAGTNRADTLALSFRSAMSVVIVIATILLVFQEAGVDITTVMGGAAILGVAIAFGAQNLMRDYFTGFLILLEDQFELGDLITIGSVTGRVEKVNMRTTMLRDLEGRVHFIPNGEIKSVTNRTYVWGRVVIEVPVSYSENVDRVMQVLLEVAKDFHQDPELGDSVTDDPVMLHVDRFADHGVIIKLGMKTKPDQIFAVRRQMLRRIKNKFDETGIEIRSRPSS